jgi:hypothetical protein
MGDKTYKRWANTSAIWPIAKYLKYHPVDKDNAIADCLENQFTPHALCEETHERRVEARVQALLETADRDPLKE